MRRTWQWRNSARVGSWALATCALGLILTAGEVSAQKGNLNYQNGFDDGHGLGVYQGTVDTHIRIDEPDTNFSEQEFLWVDGPEAEAYQLLIRFDGIVGPAPGQLPGGYIAAAELVLVVSGETNAQSNDNHPLHMLLEPWDAGAITWNNDFGGDGIDANDLEASATSLDETISASQNQTIRLDVTTAVESWLAGTPNHGLVLLPGGSNGLAIRTSEDPIVENRPLLEVSACAGNSFADAYQDYLPGFPSPTPPAMHPEMALGTPDYNSPCDESDPSCTTVSLGVGGSVTLQFLDNALTGSGGPAKDIWIFERGPDVEDTFVEISNDGSTWEDIGKVFGSTSAIDIDAFGFGPESSFSFVRLTDDPAEGDVSGWSVGADIDAICALSTVSVSPVPSLRRLGIASLVVLIVLVTSVGVLRRKTHRSVA